VRSIHPTCVARHEPPYIRQKAGIRRADIEKLIDLSNASIFIALFTLCKAQRDSARNSYRLARPTLHWDNKAKDCPIQLQRDSALKLHRLLAFGAISDIGVVFNLNGFNCQRKKKLSGEFPRTALHTP
jgi:hypothetical protein